MRRPCPTDVLSFSSLEEGGLRIGNWLGDIVISTETARRQAKRLNVNFDKEFHIYLAHGILHLLGYRDYTKKEKKEMRNEESGIMRGCHT